MKNLLLMFALVSAVTLKAQQNLETAFSKSYAFEYESQYTKAIAALIELNTSTYEVNLRLGWLYYLNKDYATSESFYKKAITIEPGSVEARFGLVLPVSALGNWNSVLSTYMDVIKLDPNNSIANYRIGLIYYNRKEYANAIASVFKVIKLYPF
ncbi:MAG: tetratricopeptide repeat protein, partial [Bacteroidia bacterium]